MPFTALSEFRKLVAGLSVAAVAGAVSAQSPASGDPFAAPPLPVDPTVSVMLGAPVCPIPKEPTSGGVVAGMTRLRLIVDRSGSVVYVSLERSSGVTRQHALQDEAVLRAFRQCRYQVIPQPGRVAPKQVDSRYLWLPRPTPPVDALRKSAAAGDANAQWILSQMLLPEPPFAAEGSSWLEKAATSGNVPAQRELGLRGLESSASKDDEARAAALIQRAADAGDPQAMLELARLYRDGRAVEASQAKYIEWLRRAAHDAVPAMRMLGEAYRDGEAVPEDMTQAAHWLSEAAQWGDGAALRDMGDLWRKGSGVRADPVLALVSYRLAESVGVPSGTAARQSMERVLGAGDRERGLAAAQAWRVGEPLPDALAKAR
ncbi:MAG TPA: hypothetical protein VF457_16330 [Burkholderiaceae bacterium]